MDRIINQWNRVDLRKSLCTVCQKRLRVPCPKCEGQATNDPCWANWHKALGYRHAHCSGQHTENNYREPIINQWNRVDLRKTVCTVCQKLLRVACPKCEGQTTDEPCWAYWHKALGYRHGHCSGPQKIPENPLQSLYGEMRKTLCTACKKHLRVPCPDCEEQNICWAYWDKTLGYRHRHCSDSQMGGK